MPTLNVQSALFTALIGDAAAMGTHWIYDPARLQDIAKTQDVAFLGPMAENYAGEVGYFAHEGRKSGALSHYGVALETVLHHLKQSQGAPEIKDYKARFVGVFGPGGHFSGYIDSPTRDALAKLAQDPDAPSGGDDLQLPALVAPIAAGHLGRDVWQPLQEITHCAPTAVAAGALVVDLLADLRGGTDLQTALENAMKAAPEPFAEPLQAALATDDADSVSYGEITGRACYLTSGLPLAFHILKHSSDTQDALRRNIMAGGDSCGRALVVGAVMGAARGVEDLPLGWSLQLRGALKRWQLVQDIAAL